MNELLTLCMGTDHKADKLEMTIKGNIALENHVFVF